MPAGIEIKSGDKSSTIDIDQDAVVAVAVRAALEVDGVLALEGGFASGLAAAFGKEGAPPGVRMSVESDGLHFQLSVVARYGANIPDLAWNLQDHVKKTVEQYVGLAVGKVNVLVVGVRDE